VTNYITVYPVSTGSAAAGPTTVYSASSASISAAGAASGSASGTCAIGSTVTVTEKETYTVTVGLTSSTSGAVVSPLQSSAPAYYPTGSPASGSGVASSSSCLSTGFVTIHKPKPTGYSASVAPISAGPSGLPGYGAPPGSARPTGYWAQ